MDSESTASTNHNDATRLRNEEESKSHEDDVDVAKTTINTTESTATTTKKPSKDDLIELIRAIKFAKPDASQSQVHKEITMELSTKSSPTTGESYEFLKNVHIHDVKKVWKKALVAASSSSSSTTTSTEGGNNTNNQDLKEKLQSSDGPVQVFTVGNNNTVQHLAREYTATHIASKIAIQKQLQADSEKERFENYVYVFLNVPGNKSGSKPHQALIHFPSKNNSTNVDPSTTKDVKINSSGGGGGSNKKKNNKKKKSGGGGAKSPTNDAATSADNNSNDDGSKKKNDDIVKIQMASPVGGDTDPSTKHPMLVYNKSRSCRTFIHPADDGYDKIQQWIIQKGVGGSLGATGGTKAYFYTNVLSYSPKKGSKVCDDILQIQISELAPSQEW